MANSSRKRCRPCEARNRVPQRILEAHALEHREMKRAGVGAQIWSIGDAAEDRRRRTYGLLGGVAIVALWGVSLWWLTR